MGGSNPVKMVARGRSKTSNLRKKKVRATSQIEELNYLYFGVFPKGKTVHSHSLILVNIDRL